MSRSINSDQFKPTWGVEVQNEASLSLKKYCLFASKSQLCYFDVNFELVLLINFLRLMQSEPLNHIFF